MKPITVREMAGERLTLARHALNLLGDVSLGGPHNAVRHSLAGLYYQGIHEAELDRSLSSDHRQMLSRAAGHEAVAAQLDAERFGFAVGLLADHDVTPVVLKGRGLASTIWPQPAFRPVGDLDLLVHPTDAGRASRALESGGFRVVATDRFPSQPYSTAFSGRDGRGNPMMVDLHRELFRTVGRGLKASPLVARAVPVHLEGRDVRLLRPDDNAAFLFVHGAKHGLRTIKWLLDAIGVAQSLDGGAWDSVVATVRQARVTTPFFATAGVVERLEPTVIPQFVLDATRPHAAKAFAVRSTISEAGALKARDLNVWSRRWYEMVLEDRNLNRARWAAGSVVQRVRELRKPRPAA
jgi:hypothetical protein